MENQRKENRGGRREGAGRKPKENACNNRASFMLSKIAAKNLESFARQKNITKNKALNLILEGLPENSRWVPLRTVMI